MLFSVGSSFTNSLYESVPAGETIPNDIVQRPALALTMLSGMLAGISAFITGIISIIGKKERMLLVYISTLIGLFLIVFLIGEMLYQH